MMMRYWMTTDEFERVVSDYFGDRVAFYDHSNDVFGVAFDDGIIAEIARDDIDSTAREGIFFLCDMWAGMDAKYSIGEAWVKEAIQRAREVQIGKLLVDGNWDNSEDA